MSKVALTALLVVAGVLAFGRWQAQAPCERMPAALAISIPELVELGRRQDLELARELLRLQQQQVEILQRGIDVDALLYASNESITSRKSIAIRHQEEFADACLRYAAS